MHMIEIYGDGSAIGNPGPGGWGAVLLVSKEGKEKTIEELGGFETHTTNNRMELTATIEALKQVRDALPVTIKTDSQYVINGATKWVFGWEKNGWQTSQKTDVINKDLWEELVAVMRKHKVTWEHVRGHMGVALNERVDVIANGYARKEKVTLYKGGEEQYAEFLKTMPKPRKVASSSSKKGKAYSYVSAVNGDVKTHATWAECEARVKGKKAKYKKAFSKEEEMTLMQEWRV